MKIINKLKTTKGMAIGILVLFSLVLGLSYGTFIFSTGNYRSTSMLISNLLYGIDITTTGGNETINTKTVTLPSGKTSTILLKITSLNDVESKYGVSYKINSGTGSVKYSSNTGWLPTGKINKNGTGTYEKVVKIVIEATSDISVDFNVDGGYTYNDLKDTKEGYTRVTEMYEGITDYTESLKTIIENETSNNIYGGEAINNYLQYPEDTDTTKNIWRIIGYYESVDGIKIIANPVKETSSSNISTELTSYYNSLTDKDKFVLETNKFSCTGINCTTSTYSNVGLLNTSEYSYIGGINSYLNDNNYYVIDNSSIKNITNGNITEASTTSNLRPLIYLKSDVKVKGSGTITNPFKLAETGDFIFTSATLNGQVLESLPSKSDPYLPNTVTCTNGSVGYWDTERGSIRLTTVNLPTECTVDFKDGYTVTLEAINGTVTAPVSKTVGRSGVTSFTVTPNTNYEATIESSTCTNGTLNGNTYTITGIKSNISCSITFRHVQYKWAKYKYVTTPAGYTEEKTYIGTKSFGPYTTDQPYYTVLSVVHCSTYTGGNGSSYKMSYSCPVEKLSTDADNGTFSLNTYCLVNPREDDDDEIYSDSVMYQCSSLTKTISERDSVGTQREWTMSATLNNCTQISNVYHEASTTKKADGYVYSYDINAYPNDGDQDGYYYKRVN